MTSVGKANKFMKLAQSYDWKTTWKADEGYEWVEVTATRGSEKIVIDWMNNQLNGPPVYVLSGMKTTLHSAAVANRTVQAARPDYESHHKRVKLSQARQGAPKDSSSHAPGSDYTLPFNMEEDPDSVILKAIRGNTIVWRNSMTGEYESELVPHKISDGKGVRVFNWDTERVFYLAQSNRGRDYLSYMNLNGVFRAVALDSLVGVL